jgi:hypothetical protein
MSIPEIAVLAGIGILIAFVWIALTRAGAARGG